MKELSETNHCERAQDLVTYLYGEASEPEASSFERHMAHCSTCAAELEAFGHVRASIGAWRAEALGSLTSPALAGAFGPAAQSASASAARKPSALAALREFFALSPMWLRGATAFAALTVCALVVFAAVKLREEPRVVVVEKVVRQGPTQAEVDAMVKTRVQEQLAARSQREEEAPSQPQAVAPAPVRKPAVIAASMTGNSVAASRRANGQRRTGVSVSAQESEQLARDLQLIPTRDEDDLPRLIDLMDEAN